VSKFSGRILPLTDDELENWAQLSAEAELRGRKLAVMDALIAATATRHQLTLVTRNVDDFIIPGLLVTNPYLSP
jgi:predicted nucleic acid-binding protein